MQAEERREGNDPVTATHAYDGQKTEKKAVQTNVVPDVRVVQQRKSTLEGQTSHLVLKCFWIYYVVPICWLGSLMSNARPTVPKSANITTLQGYEASLA